MKRLWRGCKCKTFGNGNFSNREDKSQKPCRELPPPPAYSLAISHPFPSLLVSSTDDHRFCPCTTARITALPASRESGNGMQEGRTPVYCPFDEYIAHLMSTLPEESLPQSFTYFLKWKEVESSLSPLLSPQFHPLAETAV